MKVYLSGPMTGLPEYNFPAFRRAAEKLRAQGVEVVSPAEVVPDFKGWEAAMRDNIRALVDCDTIYMLAGWPGSRGANLEKHIADALKMDVYYEGQQLKAA